MGKKRGPRYFFINRENLRLSLDRTSQLMEKMYNGFNDFKELKEALSKDDYVSLTNLDAKAGLTDKLLEKVGKAVEKFRELYIAQNLDILQTTIEDFVGKK